jgi:NDP-sugar pyrophosphorylase family protein
LINTHHRAADFRNVLSDLPIYFEESFEPEILGTAGGIANVRAKLSAPVIIHNADIDCQLDFTGLASQVAAGGLCLVCVRRAKGEGVVGIDSSGAVVRLRGESFGVEEHGADYIGVAALAADCLAELPERGCLIGDYCLPRLRAGGRIEALCRAVQWNDIGNLASYVEANLKWLSSWQQTQTAGPERSYLGDGAQVGEAVRVLECIVGARARVLGEGSLQRCIVWPDATVVAPLRDAVVTASGRVIPFTGT